MAGETFSQAMGDLIIGFCRKYPRLCYRVAWGSIWLSLFEQLMDFVMYDFVTALHHVSRDGGGAAPLLAFAVLRLTRGLSVRRDAP